jgi:hypothetical protein
MSEEDRSGELVSELGTHASFTFLRKSTAPFLQGRMTSMLATLAKAVEGDVFIPFDSDEFLGLASESTEQFDNLLQGWWSRENTSHLHIPVVDYVQSREVKEFHPKSLISASYRAAGEMPHDEWVHLIDAGGTNLLHPRRGKVLLKLTGEGSLTFVDLAEGNHSLASCDLECKSPDSFSNDLVIRHLPYHSLDVIKRKRKHWQGRREAGFDVGIGRQNNVLATSALTDWEVWERNSQLNGEIGESALTLEPDRSLEDIYTQFQEFKKSRRDPRNPPPHYSDVNQQTKTEHVARIALDWALDSDTGLTSIASAKRRAQAAEERAQAAEERAQAAEERAGRLVRRAVEKVRRITEFPKR